MDTTWLQSYQALLNAYTPEQADAILDQARNGVSDPVPDGHGGSVTVSYAPDKDTFRVVFAAPLFA